MLNQWWMGMIVGCVLGFLSGLGVGGGSLLMLWLTLVAGVDQSHARMMNLMFFIPCALIAVFFQRKQMHASRKLTFFAVTGGLAGALAGNLLHTRLDLELMRKALGVLFLISGIRELFYRERKAR